MKSSAGKAILGKIKLISVEDRIDQIEKMLSSLDKNYFRDLEKVKVGQK